VKLVKNFGIRALFGVIILALALPSICIMAIYGNEHALTTLGLIVMAVVSFYFGASSQKTPSKPEPGE
jgi:hypothetical protein